MYKNKLTEILKLSAAQHAQKIITLRPALRMPPQFPPSSTLSSNLSSWLLFKANISCSSPVSLTHALARSLDPRDFPPSPQSSFCCKTFSSNARYWDICSLRRFPCQLFFNDFSCLLKHQGKEDPFETFEKFLEPFEGCFLRHNISGRYQIFLNKNFAKHHIRLASLNPNNADVGPMIFNRTDMKYLNLNTQRRFPTYVHQSHPRMHTHHFHFSVL